MRLKQLIVLAIIAGISLLSGCSNGNSGGNSSSANPTGTITITQVSNSSPMALTPFSIQTSGLDTSQPVTVMLANTSGFSTRLTPMRVQNDGTVVVATPIVIDPTTGKTNSVDVSLTIAQGGLTSPAVSLQVQDIPQLSGYQTSAGPVTLGQISRAFYNYEILSLGAMNDGLQAMQSSPANKVDTSAAQTHVLQQLTNTVEARNDIDRIVTDNSLQIGMGTLPSGTPTTFDRNSVEIMDRVFAVYMVNIIQPAISAAGLKGSTKTSETTPQAADLTSIIKFFDGATNLTDIGGSIRKLAASDSTVSDKIAAVEVALVSGVLLVGAVTESPLILAGATTAGLLVGAHVLANSVYHVASEYLKLEQDSNAGGDPATLAQDEANLSNAKLSLGLDTVGVALGALGTVTEGVVKLGVSSSAFLVSTAGLFLPGPQNTPDAADSDQANAVAGAGQISTLFRVPGEGFGTVQGQVNITNGQGGILSGLTQVIIQDPGSGTFVSTIADVNGNYEITLPLGSSSFNYSNLTLKAVDPVSGLILSSVQINLSGLTSATVFTAPTISGSCSDSDAGNPDSDDPDCD